MGHSSFRITIDIDDHLFPDEGGEVAPRLEDLILGGKKVVAGGIGAGAVSTVSCDGASSMPMGEHIARSVVLVPAAWASRP